MAHEDLFDYYYYYYLLLSHDVNCKRLHEKKTKVWEIIVSGAVDHILQLKVVRASLITKDQRYKYVDSRTISMPLFSFSSSWREREREYNMISLNVIYPSVDACKTIVLILHAIRNRVNESINRLSDLKSVFRPRMCTKQIELIVQYCDRQINRFFTLPIHTQLSMKLSNNNNNNNSWLYYTLSPSFYHWIVSLISLHDWDKW